MAKSFYTNGVGNNQTLNNSQDEKIIIYDTIADAQSDLANLEEGQIIGTKSSVSPLTLTDVVQSGNTNAITSNGVANSLSYSKTETLTGGTWIDGKPIYRKVVNFGALPNAGSKTVNHNITNLYKVINQRGWAYSSTANDFIIIPYVNINALANCVSMYVSMTSITMRADIDRSGYSECYVVIEYTKTT